MDMYTQKGRWECWLGHGMKTRQMYRHEQTEEYCLNGQKLLMISKCVHRMYKIKVHSKKIRKRGWRGTLVNFIQCTKNINVFLMTKQFHFFLAPAHICKRALQKNSQNSQIVIKIGKWQNTVYAAKCSICMLCKNWELLRNRQNDICWHRKNKDL